MKFKIHSHRYAEDILESKYKNDWNDLKDLISNISEQKIMKLFESNKIKSNSLKSISNPLNQILNDDLLKKNWVPKKQIFDTLELDHPDPKSSKFKLGYYKNNISIDIAFHNAGTMAWNLIKPVLAFESNQLAKNIKTEVGVLITATDELKISGNFDSAIGSFEKYIKYLKILNHKLTSPLIIIGLKSTKTFFIKKSSRNIFKI